MPSTTALTHRRAPFLVSREYILYTQINAALSLAESKFGKVNAVVNCAGIAPPSRVVGRKGPHPLDLFAKVLQVNAVGTFNVARLAAARMVENSPDSNGERGCIINTAR